MEDKWIYIGIFLDESSKKKLKKLYKLPEGWKEYFDHMTVIYNDDSEYAKYVKSISDNFEGKKIELKVVSQGISNKAYAIHVDIPSGIPCGNKISHITLGCSPEGFAVDSNYIENWHNILKPFTIKGTLKTFKSNGLTNINIKDI